MPKLLQLVTNSMYSSILQCNKAIHAVLKLFVAHIMVKLQTPHGGCLCDELSVRSSGMAISKFAPHVCSTHDLFTYRHCSLERMKSSIQL